MDYNSFLTRDYKSLITPPREANKPRWTRLHVLLLVAIILVAGTVLTLLSGEAAATKSASREALEPEISQEKQKVTIPLNFPALERIETSATTSID